MNDDQRRPAATGAPVSASQVIAAAREVVRQLEPEELPLFDATAQAWLAGDLPGRRPRRREPGAAVGFGIEAVLLGELVFPIITGALSQVLGTPITERLRPGKRAMRKAAKEGAATAAGISSPADRDGAEASLTDQQLHAIHEACQRDAAAMGLAAARAQLLADAVVGTLARTAP